ncbi:MAG: SMR family transporter [Latilactobacillus curvatus]
MDWLILIASGAMEAVWATALGRSNGLKKLVPTVVFVVASILSIAGLGVALRTIPSGTGYAVWAAIGATLTTLWAFATRTERVTVLKTLCILGIVVAVVGLKVTA